MHLWFWGNILTNFIVFITHFQHTNTKNSCDNTFITKNLVRSKLRVNYTKNTKKYTNIQKRTNNINFFVISITGFRRTSNSYILK